jgi:hypothetical protein
VRGRAAAASTGCQAPPCSRLRAALQPPLPSQCPPPPHHQRVAQGRLHQRVAQVSIIPGVMHIAVGARFGSQCLPSACLHTPPNRSAGSERTVRSAAQCSWRWSFLLLHHLTEYWAWAWAFLHCWAGCSLRSLAPTLLARKRFQHHWINPPPDGEGQACLRGWISILVKWHSALCLPLACGRPPLGPRNLWDSAGHHPCAREARRLHHEWP